METIASRNCDPGEVIGLWMFGALAADTFKDECGLIVLY